MTKQRHRSTGSLHSLRVLCLSGLVVVTTRLALSLRATHRLQARIDKAHARNKRAAPDPQMHLHDMREVAWAVAASARVVPGASCLTQAMAGRWLLARRGWESVVELSLPMEMSKGFRPHAWLLSGETIVLGGTSRDYARHRRFERPVEMPAHEGIE